MGESKFNRDVRAEKLAATREGYLLHDNSVEGLSVLTRESQLDRMELSPSSPSRNRRFSSLSRHNLSLPGKHHHSNSQPKAPQSDAQKHGTGERPGTAVVGKEKSQVEGAPNRIQALRALDKHCHSQNVPTTSERVKNSLKTSRVLLLDSQEAADRFLNTISATGLILVQKPHGSAQSNLRRYLSLSPP